MAKKVHVNSVQPEESAFDNTLFFKEDGKARWFEPNTDALTGEPQRDWEEYQDALEATNKARVKFERSFYSSLQKAAKGGKLNGMRALEVGINKGYAIRFGYKWGKLSISFEPGEKYKAPGEAGGSNKFSF